MGLALRFIIAFESALDVIWGLGTTPAREPRGSYCLRYSAPGPATSGHVAMETDLPTNIILPRLTGLPPRHIKTPVSFHPASSQLTGPPYYHQSLFLFYSSLYFITYKYLNRCTLGNLR